MARKYFSLADRLAANSVVDTTCGCRVWTGYLNNKGYPRMSVRLPGHRHPVTTYAHRVAYELHTGEPIPAGLSIDHLCCNTACIEPTHMQLVTVNENTTRQWERARAERFGP